MSAVRIVPNARVVANVSADRLSVARADTLNAASQRTERRQLTVAAAGEPIAILYGRDKIGPAICRIVSQAGALVVLYVWGYGPYDAREALWLNDVDVSGGLPAGVTFEHYLGTQTTVSPMLAAAYAANGITFTNVMPNVVFSVGKFDPGAVTGGVPTLAARFRGRLILNPATGVTAWSDNPTLALRDMLAAPRTTYGFGLSVTAADVIACAAENDAMIGSPSEKRRTFNYNFDKRISAGAMVDLLRTAAGCFVVLDTFPARFIPDKDRAAVRTFSRSEFRTLRASRKSRFNRPTVIQINYTRITGSVHETDQATYALPGVAGGTLPRIVSAVDMPWVNRHSQADREAKERANKLLNDIGFEGDAFDEALQVTHGDIIAISDADNGWSTKKFLVTAVQNPSPSQFAMSGFEVDVSNWSDDVVTAPASQNTTLPDPRVIPTVTALTVSESPISTTTAALNISWTAPVWPFVSDYRVIVYDAERAVFDNATTTTGITTPPLPIGRAYRVYVYVRSSVAQGEGAVAVYTIDGLLDDVPGEMLYSIHPIMPDAASAKDWDALGRESWKYGYNDPKLRNYRSAVYGGNGEVVLWQSVPDNFVGGASSTPVNTDSTPIEQFRRYALLGSPPLIPGGEYIPPAEAVENYWTSTQITVFSSARLMRAVVDLETRNCINPGDGTSPFRLTVKSGATVVDSGGYITAASVTAAVDSPLITSSIFVGAREVAYPGRLLVYVPTINDQSAAPIMSSASVVTTITCARVFDAVKTPPRIVIANVAPRVAVVSNIVFGALSTTFDVAIFNGAAQVAESFTWSVEGAEKI